MVHALESAAELVKRRGKLIIVHDKPYPVTLEMQWGLDRELVGYLLDREEYAPIQAANAALESWQKAGGVELLVRDEFPFRTRIDTFEDFQLWLDERLEWSFLEEPVIERIKLGFQAGNVDTQLYASHTADIYSFSKL